MKIIKKIINWFKNNYDKDLYFCYDEENILKMEEKNEIIKIGNTY